MNNNPLQDVPAVRLASGIEPQQKWSMTDNTPMSTTMTSSAAAVASQKHGNNSEGPKLVELNPSFGNEGTIVTVVVQALPPQIPVKLAFSSLMVDTKQLQAQGITSLVATVPSFQQTHSTTSTVPISVCYFDKDMVTETWMVAEFTYHDENKQSTNTVNSTNDHYQINVDYNDKNNNTFQAKDNNDFYHNLYSPTTVNSPYNFGTQVPGYQQYAYQQQESHRDMLMGRYNQQARNNQQLHTSPYNTYNHSALNFFPSANTGGFTSMLAGAMDQTTTNTTTTTTTTTSPNTTSATISPLNPGFNPQQQSQTRPKPRQSHANGGSTVFGFKSTTHTPTTSVANYQPYPGLVSRANLDIAGDLDSMTKNWNTDEWNHRRRLVQFWREQNSNKITTTFQPVPQGERATNSGNIVVSCIYWVERNDFFITSVDCIYLLECLMDIRFSVEEKNRIRRNLEGFRPLTVSKCKTDSAEFFKLIMSFPNPKPRNIEKDVKVFPWKTLPYALKKIVTKYTASSYNNIGTSQKMNQQASDRTAASTVSTPNSVLPPTPALSTPIQGIHSSPQTPQVGHFYQNNGTGSNYQTPSYAHTLYEQTTSYFDHKPYQQHQEDHVEKKVETLAKKSEEAEKQSNVNLLPSEFTSSPISESKNTTPVGSEPSS